jgi:glycosyltransferase involved in cell wall biosynthesis
MNILFVSHTADLGGGERSLLTFLKNTKELFDIRVLFPKEGPLVSAVNERGIKSYVSSYEWWTVRRGATRHHVKETFPRQILDAKKILSKIEGGWKPEVIYTNTSVVCVGALIAQMLKVNHIWHIREYGEKDHGFVYEYGLEDTGTIINALSSSVIFNSEAVRKEFDNIEFEKSYVIYNAVEIPQAVLQKNTDKPAFSYNSSFKLLIAGTISERKGQLDAVESVANLINKGYNLELVLMGHCNDLSLKEKIMKIKHTCKDPNKIRLLEYRENPYPVFLETDVVMVTSKNEAFGRTILEGWLMDKPVIATNKGGVPEIVSDQVNGLLYTPGDTSKLSQQIAKLYSDSDLRSRLANDGRKRALKKFGVDNYVRSIESVINKTVEKKFTFVNTPLLAKFNPDLK